MQDQINIFLGSLNQFWLQVINFLPRLLAVVVILFAGWLIARASKAGTRRLLELAHFDKIASRSGLEAFLKHDEIDLTLAGIISQVVYWMVILLFIITAANALGLNEVSRMLQALAGYLPEVIVAILVMIFGTLLGRFVNRLVFTWLYGINFSGALAVSTSAEYAIQIFALFVALEQLGLGTKILTALFVIVFGAISLALAIAFGLGGREWAADIIASIRAGKTRR
ncbi:hypothetical protein GALL_331040 [mine drainage metagenome]|uniref:Uncharacterized protein n=1 Tax=mine drainage metagenome TaxID=410659 RepID=A0A1J5QNU4_9ZZZZ